MSAPRQGPETPVNATAEMAVLGSILQDVKAAQLAATRLVGADFYQDKHRFIFEAACDLLKAGKPVDRATVYGRLLETRQAEQVPATLMVDIEEAVPSSANVATYIDQLLRVSRQRLILIHGKRLVERVTANGDDPDAHLRDFLEMVGTPHAGQSAESFEVLPAAEFLQASFAGAVRLVPSIGLTAAGVGILSGAGGGGKSLLALNLALAWTGATLPIGEAIPAARTLRVMVFQVEDAAGIVQERLRTILGSMSVPRGLFLFTRKEPMRFSGARGKPNEPALDRLQATLRRHAPIDVAIFDPLIYLHESEENSSSEMTRWLVPFREVCRQAGTAPFIVHHAGWTPDGEDARGRGSTAIRAWSDLELALRAQTKNGRTLHRLNLVKTNFTARWKEPLTLQLNEQTLRFEAVDETGVLCPPEDLVVWLREDHDGRWTEKREDLYAAICAQFGCEGRTAIRAVKRAKDLGLLVDHGQRTPLECGEMVP